MSNPKISCDDLVVGNEREAVVVEKPQEESAAPPMPGGGMGGMY